MIAEGRREEVGGGRVSHPLQRPLTATDGACMRTVLHSETSSSTAVLVFVRVSDACPAHFPSDIPERSSAWRAGTSRRVETPAST